METLAHRFFVRGTITKCEYGAAPVVQFNTHQKTGIRLTEALQHDTQIFERALGIGFFHYGPRLWMVGEVEPLKALQVESTRTAVVKRILDEYPTREITPAELFYRIRTGPRSPDTPLEYDSPPDQFLGRGRLDSEGRPVLYGSRDLELCVHECRVTAEDETYVATLQPSRTLKILDLTALLPEEHVTEFESLDMAVHLLFLAGKHSYPITRAIAEATARAGLDGLVYPSHFSLQRIGTMPLPTSYGISHRRFPSQQAFEEAKSLPNIGLFGRPIASGLLRVSCINRLVVSRVGYEFHFGPASV